MSVLREHMGIEALTIFALAVTGYAQGEAPSKLLSSFLWGFAALGVICLCVFVYQYAMFPVVTLTEYEARIKPIDADYRAKLEIIFRPGESPFDESLDHLKQLSVGVRVSDDPNVGAEDVSLRLEKLQPNPESVPLLEFREMVFPFSQRTRVVSGTKLEERRSVNLNPNQTRFFQVVLTYGGKYGLELCFYPSNYYSLQAGTYLLGLRATGKNVNSDYAEFRLTLHSDDQLNFVRV